MATYNLSMATKGVKKPKGKLKMKDMDVDTFLNAEFDSESESSSTKSSENEPRKKKMKPSAADMHKTGSKSKLKVHIKSLKSNISKSVPQDPEALDAVKKSKLKLKGKKGSITKITKENEISKPNPSKTAINKLKQSPALTLQENDPEFYEFLKDQDKGLLNNLEDLFDSNEDTSGEDDEEVDDTNDLDMDTKSRSRARSSDKSKKVKANEAFEKELLTMSSGEESDSESEQGDLHKLPTQLEVASDEDDEEEEDKNEESGAKRPGILITQAMVDSWSNSLSSKPTIAVLREVVSGFHAALQEAGGSGDEKSSSKYRVEGGMIFNNVVRLCLAHMAPALQSVLGFSDSSDNKSFTKSARWKKVKVLVKSYTSDILNILSQLSEEAMINAILKHVHKLIFYYANFPKLSKQLVKKMIKLWATGEETTRVLAFLCINKVIRLKQDILLESTLKQMYMAYVSNSKFTSPTTLPLINFLQKSLVELFVIDQTLAYQYAFVYIRQLAIHLRNAISVKKRNTCQAVYNWQYIHCLGLWVHVLSTTHPSEILQPLIYPLTQTIIGTVKLLPTARFYPLRFHCVGLLNKLSLKTGTFIPTLPFLMEVFEQTDFNKKHKNVSLKPFNFAVMLKFSKPQLQEKAFKDGLIDQLYEYLLESFNNQAHSIGFPELILPSLMQLKEFLKKCKIANYCKQIKQIVDKIQEQSKVIVEQRKKSNISLVDNSAVNQWERQLEEKGTPLRKFYTSWRKLRDRELQHAIANKDAISGAAVDIPTVERKPLKKATQQEREDYSKLFENDSESEDETRFLSKEERPKDESKKRKRVESESDDEDYSDFDDDELEQLARSASSDEGSEDEGSDVEMDDESEVEDISKENMKVNGGSKQQNAKTNGINGNKEDAEIDGDEDVVEDFVLSGSDSE